VVPLIGQDFYGRVKTAHAVIQTGEPRLYANIILRKGVIYPKEPGTHAAAGVDPFVY
jgi:L-fucose mutarotase